MQFYRIAKLAGSINKLQSFREPTPLYKQSVIRMNHDTFYSFAIIDISKGAKLTMPEADGRYNSAMIVNEMEYINKAFYEPGCTSSPKTSSIPTTCLLPSQLRSIPAIRQT